MRRARLLCAVAVFALVPSIPGIAQDALTSLHPEDAYPDDAPRLNQPGRWSGFIGQVQEKLHERGFDAGPINGDFNSKTQAALAQFQLSVQLPVNGMLDDATRSALGLTAASDEPEQDASTGR